MNALRAWGLAVLLSGCIDLEGARSACFDSGRCGVERDAGMDAGALDAGLDAGIDAGLDYDGGPRCTGSTSPRLRCDSPLTLGTGTGIQYAAMASNDDGLILGWRGASIEVRAVHLDGGVEPLITGVSVNQAELALGAAGRNWVATWVDQGSHTATCLTNALDAGTQVFAFDAGVKLEGLTAAIDRTGTVGVAAKADSAYVVGASAAGGCPTSLSQLPFGANGSYLNSVAVVSTASGLRYVWTEQINAYNGLVGLSSEVDLDGGWTAVSTPSSLRAPLGLAVAASSSGASVFSAYDALNASDKYELDLWSTSADLSGDGTAETVSSVSPGWWSAGPCGPTCMGLGVISYDKGGPASVILFSDQVGVASRGTWDVVCGLLPTSTQASTISVGTLAGRIAVMVTTPTAAKLYLCDDPP